jgi:hypothetical protein
LEVSPSFKLTSVSNKVSSSLTCNFTDGLFIETSPFVFSFTILTHLIRNTKNIKSPTKRLDLVGPILFS